MKPEKGDKELIVAMVLSLFMGLCQIGFSINFYFTDRPPFAADLNEAMTMGAEHYLLKMMNGAFFWAGIIFWIIAFLIWSYRRKMRTFRAAQKDNKPVQTSN